MLLFVNIRVYDGYFQWKGNKFIIKLDTQMQKCN